MKIAVIGLGYVGISMAMLLSRKREVWAYDIDATKLEMINSKISPILDEEVSYYLANEQLNLTATADFEACISNSQYVIIATPTNYDPTTNMFDTKSVDSVIEHSLKINPTAKIVIKSTIPVGYTKAKQLQYPHSSIMFSPEFLREGRALRDNLHPSRIVVGDMGEAGRVFAQELGNCSLDISPPILLTTSCEAEAIKLFSNTYLAMRIAYFNELDSFAENQSLNAERIIKGVSLDPRIGMHYNNPSFGYGGYCLPKDTKQLLANFQTTPNEIISAIVKSNLTRKRFIASSIIARKPKIVGIYKLAMKSGSDNYRDSSIIDIMMELKASGIDLLIYDPTISSSEFLEVEVSDDFLDFKLRSDLIIANRYSDELTGLGDRLYTRDIFNDN